MTRLNQPGLENLLIGESFNYVRQTLWVKNTLWKTWIGIDINCYHKFFL